MGSSTTYTDTKHTGVEAVEKGFQTWDASGDYAERHDALSSDVAIHAREGEVIRGGGDVDIEEANDCCSDDAMASAVSLLVECKKLFWVLTVFEKRMLPQ